MKITQIYDEPLAQAGYVISDRGEAAVIDPARDTEPVLEQLKRDGAKLKAVILTHPHADFISGHQDLAQKTGAKLYMSKLLQPTYKVEGFDAGDNIMVGNTQLSALNTPGHSPDSISILVSEDDKQKAVFTGDTLFIGDVGRPDLREAAGAQTAARESLARDMYRSTREILMNLDDDVLVYPAHGAGTLCGKNLSDERSSTIGQEKKTNIALQPMTEDEFVKYLVSDQPFMPIYFGYDVETNRGKMLPELSSTLEGLKQLNDLDETDLVVDVRDKAEFRGGYIRGSINIPAGEDDKFETWVGSIVNPEEAFYISAKTKQQVEIAMQRLAKIGYEVFVAGYALVSDYDLVHETGQFDSSDLKVHEDGFTIVDVRNVSEQDVRYFEHAINIPLHQLRSRYAEIPKGKAIVVHCAGGYRSAVAASILRRSAPSLEIHDLGDDIKSFEPLKEALA